MNAKHSFASRYTIATTGLGLLILSACGSVGCSSPTAAPAETSNATDQADAITDLDTVPASSKTTKSLGVKTWGFNPSSDGTPGAVIHAYDASNALMAEIVHSTTELDNGAHQIDISVTSSKGSHGMSVIIIDPADDAEDQTAPSAVKVKKNDLSTDDDAMAMLTAMDSDVGAKSPTTRKDGTFASEVGSSADPSDFASFDPGSSDLKDSSLKVDYWGEGLVNKAKELVHKVDCNIVEPIKCGDGLYKVVRDGIKLVKGCGEASAEDVGEEEAAGALCSAATGVETAGAGAAVCETGAQVAAVGTVLWQCGKAVYGAYKDASGADSSCKNSEGKDKCAQ